MNALDTLKSLKKALPVKFDTADYYKQALRVLARLNSTVKPCYPDFLCIGAPRSGTSWLFRNLHKHPGVFIPWFKEIHFFDEPVSDDDFVQKRPLFDLHDEASWRWYSLVFRNGAGFVKGDITPAYMLLSPERIRLIKQRMPQARLIFIMRNPVDRAWSGTRRSLWSDEGVRPSDLASLDEVRKVVFSPPIIDRGDYRLCMQNWEAEFDREQIHYLFFEDLFADPERQLESIVNFLGLPAFEDIGALNLTKRINAAPFEQPPEPIRLELVEHYRAQIVFLEQRFQRDLGHWLDPSAT